MTQARDMLIALGVSLALAVLPGAWITFGLRLRDLEWHVRVAIAVAFSPPIVGAQLLTLKLLGVGFPVAALVIPALNAPSLFLVCRSARRAADSTSRPDGASAAVAIGALAATLLIPWLAVPQFRTFAWHSLIHTDIIYELVRAPAMPEDPEMAGIALAYPWMGHASWAIAAWLGDVPPTAIFPFTNVLWLVVTSLLVYWCATRAFDLRPSTAGAAVALAGFGGQVIPFTAQLFVGDGFRWREHFVHRASPLLEKHRGFETMPFGIALLAAIFMVSALGLKRDVKGHGLLLACLLAALGIVYPLLYPVGLVAAVSVIGIRVLSSRLSPPRTRTREVWLALAGIGASIVVFLLVLWLYMPNGTGTVPVATEGRKAKVLQASASLAFLIAGAAPGAFWALRHRHAPLLFAGWLSICAAVAFVQVDAASLEYKYVTIAALFLAPIAAKSLELCVRNARNLTAASVAVVLLLATVDLAWFLLLRTNVPRNLHAAPMMTDAGFWLRLDPVEGDLAWVDVVREATPQETVVVARNARIHLGPFLQRTLFAPADAHGESSAGYSVSNRAHLVEERRYPAALVDSRIAAAERLLNPASESALAAALSEVQALRRPVAIHFPDPSARALRWLARLAVGREIWHGPGGAVWFVGLGESMDPASQVVRRHRGQVR